ncbi:hypothetical protein [Vagococcus intermedius]|uniref:Uncharacterized protein n=1 Tax=Vagococcus intermedius TaxID=2991418 RepID=A0AAF0CSZ7_9ENTE|nr:hypothetical protein [Vagococcus intermedius]WEG72385.1 hypothetical protein OL234_05205 [Vagococcus intermedius]WEG74473.1 hypothetical protein OL235_05210 [Vagococcus intermedius]
MNNTTITIMILINLVLILLTFLSKDYSKNQNFYILFIVGIINGISLFGWISVDGVPEAARYSAFLQNFAMSLLFINFYFMRKGNRGQSLTIAIAKWIGTLAPTILMGVVQSFNPFIIICGVFCSVFDIFYIYLLSPKNKLLSLYS